MFGDVGVATTAVPAAFASAGVANGFGEMRKALGLRNALAALSAVSDDSREALWGLGGCVTGAAA